MTQEQKAKAYDEALERARELSKTTTGANYEYIFPELAESEDERIRKEILSLIQYTKGRRIGYEPRIHQDEMLAWLEKQDEKSVAINSTKAYRIGFADGEAYAKAEMQSSWSEADEKMLIDIITDVKFAQDKIFFEDKINWLKSLKERVQPQPKQEWSEEDNEIFSEAISVLLASSCSYDDIKKVSEWLKSIKQRMGG